MALLQEERALGCRRRGRRGRAERYSRFPFCRYCTGLAPLVGPGQMRVKSP